MTINNPGAWDEYTDALGEEDKIAEAADYATNELMLAFKRKGISFPNDDRIANIELLIYQTAKGFNK